jgi:hypothetical protein
MIIEIYATKYNTKIQETEIKAIIESGETPRTSETFICLKLQEGLPANLPQVGFFYKHKNGNKYRIIAITNAEGDDESKREKYPVTVVYQGSNGKIWSRRADEWNRSFNSPNHYGQS